MHDNPDSVDTIGMFGAFALQLASALADGKITPEEGAALIARLAAMPPTRSLFRKATGWIEDLACRDAEELGHAAREHDRKADKAQRKGREGWSDWHKEQAHRLRNKAMIASC